MNERLAIHGGDPAVPEGPPSWPITDEGIRLAIDAALHDGSWGRYYGPHSERLVESLAELHDVEYVFLCCSGTLAVELALRGLKIGGGDEVILAAYDFSGNFRCIEAVGARPVLVDIDASSWCLDANQIDAAISDRTKAVIVSHLHGGLADMKHICELAACHNLKVVEDACQVTGASVAGRVAGTWGDVGVLSFGGSKLLSAGRGGAIVTRDLDILQRARVFCERGNHSFPLSELQAAVLIPQVEVLPERNATRLANVAHLRKNCESLLGLRMVVEPPMGSRPSFFKLAFDYNLALLNDRSRNDFINAVQAEGIAIDVGFRGFTRRSSRRSRRVGDLQHSDAAARNTLVLHHPVLLESLDTIDRVVTGIQKVLNAFSESTK